VKPLNVAIVGGGPGCKAIMEMIFAEKLSQLHMQLIGVASTNPEAVGYCYAREKGIYTTGDYRDFYELENLDMIIELTGRDDLANEIYRTKPQHVRVMDHVSARVFWDVFRIEEESIAERQRSEEITRLAFAELNQIFETSANGMRVIDKKFNVLRVNESFSNLSGVRKGQAVGEKCYNVFGGSRCHTPACPLTRILGGEGRIESDAVKHRRDGTAVSCIVTATAFRAPEGDLIGIVEDFKDISERNRVETALCESEEQYRNVVERASDGIGIIQDGVIKFVNRRGAEIGGYSVEELTGTPFKAHIHPDELAKVAGRYQRRMAGGNVPAIYETVLRAKNGGKVDVEINAGVISYEGKPSDLVIIRDITERKQAQLAVDAERRRLFNLLEGLPAYVCLLAEDYTIRFANRHFRERFGDPKQMPCYEVLGGHKAPCRECKTFDVFKTDSAAEWEWTSKDGRTYQIYDYPFIDVDGAPLVMELGIDITERKRLETQLVQAQKMEAIGTLAGGIAHDFNNLLMGIQGNASLMMLSAGSDHPHFEYLRGVEEMVRKGADLTKQLLGFARGGKYEVRPTDLSELIKRSSQMFGRTKKEIEIHTEYGEGIWPVEVDRGQMEQVLLNLYVNAWQVMPTGGDLHIETSNVVLDKSYTKPFGVKPGRFVKASVTDTGSGMDKETQQRIFDPFFTTKEMGRGTGLGLASAYGIIKNHGGIINVYSEKGRGTTFTIYLPASENFPAVWEGGESEAIAEGQGTILLVDDEEVILKVGGEMLGAIGYTVRVAKGGTEAVDIYGKHRDEIDLVILDMIMPDMGGGEAYDRMKEINPAVRVLLSSGYSINGRAAEIMARGCDGFIQKPFDMHQLSWKVRQILDEQP